MFKGKNIIKAPKSLNNLAKHQFDTSSYVILKDGIRRVSESGKFVSVEAIKSPPKTKK